MVGRELPKLETGVRFSVPALRLSTVWKAYRIRNWLAGKAKLNSAGIPIRCQDVVKHFLAIILSMSADRNFRNG